MSPFKNEKDAIALRINLYYFKITLPISPLIFVDCSKFHLMHINCKYNYSYFTTVLLQTRHLLPVRRKVMRKQKMVCLDPMTSCKHNNENRALIIILFSNINLWMYGSLYPWNSSFAVFRNPAYSVFALSESSLIF